MSGNPDPDTTNIPRPVPAWSCQSWSEQHDWLSCPPCQEVYEAHLEAEQRGEPGVLHWRKEQDFLARCGSRSNATTTHLNGAESLVEELIDGHYYKDLRVTCPRCRYIARNEGVLREIPNSDRPDPQTREAILDWQKEQSD